MSVLVSYIPTPEGWAAYQLGLEEAKLRGTSLVVVNVRTGNNAASVTSADEKDLDDVRSGLVAEGIPHEIVQVVDAVNAADAILKIASERQTDLIVVGLRRRSPVRMALLGSNAQQIILAAECPVLSVRPAASTG
ncbi:universal stress protein family protein [Jatrophihabitans sp. GAS493]|uniref:universal stress protein n=1 Tax=Jatrophihabitans sp. GAS493 TaxID=1907575 RepID=UPI000BB690A3|nr:universal stress protein [Jatrophihabitans sp. GAS493]SOD74647.1 universal stress protein family protein [Jatrophihabitans sp. GAS493]